MKASMRVTFDFAASHTAPSCARADGHAWIVGVEVDGDVNYRTGMVADYPLLAQTIRGLQSEFASTNLNDMLPGVTTTPEGVAAYVHERLVMMFPISRISVDMRPGYRAELEWPRR